MRFPGQTFGFGRFGLASLAVVLGAAVIALPSAAVARSSRGGKGKRTIYTMNTTSVVQKGFKVKVYAFQTNPGYGSPIQTTFSVYLKKTSGKATQAAVYTFNKGIKFKGTTNLSTAKVSGKFADSRGSVNMSWKGSGSTKKAPGKCSGGTSGSKRSGTFKGTLTLKADNLGTITLKSLKTTVSTATTGECSHSLKGYIVEGYNKNDTWYVKATKPSSTGSVHEEIDEYKSAGGDNPAWSFAYSYAVNGQPSSDYTIGSKLSSATITGSGGISGTATYTGSKGKKHSNGKLTGDLSAPNGVIGTLTPPSSLSADQRAS